MRIEVRGRNTAVTDGLRDHVEDRFGRVARQVPDRAHLEVELRCEKNPSIADSKVAEAALHLKGITLRAHQASADLESSIDLCAEKLARQVKRHRSKRRGRREGPAARAAEASP